MGHPGPPLRHKPRAHNLSPPRQLRRDRRTGLPSFTPIPCTALTLTASDPSGPSFCAVRLSGFSDRPKRNPRPGLSSFLALVATEQHPWWPVRRYKTPRRYSRTNSMLMSS